MIHREVPKGIDSLSNRYTSPEVEVLEYILALKYIADNGRRLS